MVNQICIDNTLRFDEYILIFYFYLFNEWLSTNRFVLCNFIRDTIYTRIYVDYSLYIHSFHKLYIIHNIRRTLYCVFLHIVIIYIVMINEPQFTIALYENVDETWNK